MAPADQPRHNDPRPPRPDGGHIVRVHAFVGRRRGVCTCGWVGPRRCLLRGVAPADALLHAAAAGHQPGWPLVVWRLHPAPRQSAPQTATNRAPLRRTPAMRTPGPR
jgi:hypothetical protein